MAGTGRARQRAARTESPHPRWRRRCRIYRDSARQTPRRHGRNHSQRPKRGLRSSLGADTVIDYHNEDFEQVLHSYDVVLDSLGGENLKKSLRVLKPGGKAIGISGPPDPAFAREIGLNPLLRLAITGLSSSIRRQARKLGVSYEFLFMHASGDQLRNIAELVDDGALRPVLGQVFPFEETPQGLRTLSKGGIRGKAVISNTRNLETSTDIRTNP